MSAYGHYINLCPINMQGEKQLLSTKEVAQILKISDRHVRRLINEGLIPAKKVGRNFVIEATQLNPIFQKATEAEKQFIRKAIDKIVKDYGETLRLLGNE